LVNPLTLIIIAAAVIGFIKFGGAAVTADFLQTAKADLGILKASLLSDPVTDINSKTTAGLRGNEA